MEVQESEGVMERGFQIDLPTGGYVRFVGCLGDDRQTVDAARARKLLERAILAGRDRRLIQYLGRHAHESPFRHCVLSFQVKAELMTARQHWKYVVGSAFLVEDEGTAWNEYSRRIEPDQDGSIEFYTPSPEEWRTAGRGLQGSGELLATTDLRTAEALTFKLQDRQGEGLTLYDSALRAGVEPGQARLFLDAYGVHQYYQWTASLQAVCHMLDQREEENAQGEIRLLASAVRQMAEDCYPLSFAELWDVLPGQEGT